MHDNDKFVHSALCSETFSVDMRSLDDIVVEDDGNVSYPNLVYHSCGISSIICIIITVSQLTHVITFYRKNKQDQNFIIYVLFVIRLFATISICLWFLFLKSNYLSKLTYSQYYNKAILFTSYYGNILFVQISQSTLFLLFIYRIQIVFKNTVYQYPKSLLYSLYIAIPIAYIITSTLSWFAHNDTQFIIYKLGDNNQLYTKATESSNYNIISWLAALSLVLWQIAFNIICLYLFTKRLIKLKKSLIEQYAMEISRITSGSVTSPSLSATTPSTEETHTPSQTHTVRITEIRRRRKNGNAADRILNLKELIKRHTILVWMTVGCSTIFFILYSISPWVITQQQTLFTIINILIWMMFGCCDNYWKFAKKNLCCYICYIDDNHGDKSDENRVEMKSNVNTDDTAQEQQQQMERSHDTVKQGQTTITPNVSSCKVDINNAEDQEESDTEVPEMDDNASTKL